MNDKKLAIFDLDGTLFDTREVNYLAYKEALRPYNITLDEEYFKTKCNGRHYTEFIPRIMGTTEYLEEVQKAKKQAYAHNLASATVNEHLFSIIRNWKVEYHCAVVTTASRKNVMDILSFFHVEDLFDCIITQEDISHPKPDPEGFLLAMDHFKAAPQDTVIFEDSDVGIAAARATGATVIVVDRF